MAAKGQKAQNAHQPTEASKRQVAGMAAAGVSFDKIAKVIGINYRTLVSHYEAEIRDAKARAEALVAQNLFNKASKGTGSEAIKAALIWLHNNSDDLLEQPKKIGRPSSYNEQKALAICDIISQGKPYTPELAKRLGLPSYGTVFRWLHENETFRQHYARARELQADAYAEQIVHIADNDPDASRARNRIDARKWHASHTNPKRWGDSQRIDINVDMGKTAATVLMELSQRATQHEPALIDVTPPLIREGTAKDNSDLE